MHSQSLPPADHGPARISSAPADDGMFIARQPIFDRTSRVYGYELLFRSSDDNVYTASDGKLASSLTVHRALHTIGLGAVAGDKMIFVNFPRELVVQELWAVLPPERSVVELLEFTAIDEELVAACKSLRQAGYKLALDDVTDPVPVRPLLNYADYLKIDFRGITRERRPAFFRELADYRGAMLAEKIETREDFDEALAMGCRYVQGYFFCRPEILASSGKSLAGSSLVYMQLMRELNRPQLDFARIEELIKRDVALSYKLLRYLNSAAHGIRHKVSSIRQALVMLGERPVRKWGALLAVSNISREKPPELLIMSLVRGRFCERLAQLARLPDRQLDMFLVGLLSHVDVALDLPMEFVLSQLEVSDGVRAVLLDDPSAPADLRRAYTLARACERGAWGTVVDAAAGLRLTQPEIASLYYESLVWADDAFVSAVAA